ncbi:MAG: response regulator [Lachnospiraceae bacterium]|nr:response regulator [Lachnospiraceae bacterium]
MDKREFILIVDEDTSERQELKEYLSEAYRVGEYANGKEAFDYLSRNPLHVDMIIVGFHLENLDGFELIHLLKESKPLNTIPVIMLADGEETQRKAIESGVVDVITKPFTQPVVLCRVKNALRANNVPAFMNVMEDLVKEQIDKNINTFGICQCAVCRSDLAALTLNHLSPKYVSTEKGRLISATEKMSYDNILEIVKAIAECAEIIKQNPRHEKNLYE